MTKKAVVSIAALLALSVPTFAAETNLGSVETNNPASTVALLADSVTHSGNTKTFSGLHLKISIKTKGEQPDVYDGVAFATMGLTGGSKEQQESADNVTNIFCKKMAKMGKAQDYQASFSDELSSMEANPGHDWLVMKNAQGNLEAQLASGKTLMSQISTPAYNRMMRISQITCGK